MMVIKLVIVIINYKTPRLVINCLASLLPEISDLDAKVVVVDNYSQDGSASIIRKYIVDNCLADFVELIASPKNGGFSYGNNLAIKPFLNGQKPVPQYILLLNPDTVVKKNAISELVNFMDKHPRAGIAGSRLEGPDGRHQCSSFRFHTLLSEFESSVRLGLISRLLSRWRVAPGIPKDIVQVDWVSGASMVIRTDVFMDIGLMDENYFLYFEETDFCLQAKHKGWECWYVPTSRVVHLVGQSTGVKSGSLERTRRPRYWFEARQYYFLKNHGLFYTIMTDLTWLIGFSIWRLRRKIQRKPDTDPEKMLLDFWKNSVFFRSKPK